MRNTRNIWVKFVHYHCKKRAKIVKINLDKLLSNDVIQALSQDCMRLQKVAWTRSNPLCSTRFNDEEMA